MAVTLDWYGCATFRLRVAGLTIFCDAYIDRVPGAAGTGLSASDIDECDWIVVGHSHFDHLWGAETIALATGASVIGSYETVRIMAEQGVPDAQLYPVAGGESVELGDDISVSVYPSQHSCVWSHTGMGQTDEVCIGDLGVTYQEQRERFAKLMEWFETLGEDAMEHMRISNQGARGDGGALVYLFDTPEGSLLYQDTSGHWSGVLHDLRPDVAILAAAGRGNIDGEPIQGSLAQFVARQADLIRPDRVVLSHHDDWLPGFSVDTDVEPIRDELARAVPRAQLLELGYVDGTEIFVR